MEAHKKPKYLRILQIVEELYDYTTLECRRQQKAYMEFVMRNTGLNELRK